jgi:hypothetical protein
MTTMRVSMRHEVFTMNNRTGGICADVKVNFSALLEISRAFAASACSSVIDIEWRWFMTGDHSIN